MIITQTPLRISFASDESGVLSSAIDKFVYVIVKERLDDKIYLSYSKKEVVDDIKDVKLGLAREALRQVGLDGGVEISYLADIPSSLHGLGSASAFTVGTLNALYQFVGYSSSARRLSQESAKILRQLKRKISTGDPEAVSYGGLRFIRTGRNAKIEPEPVKLDERVKTDLDNFLLLFCLKKPEALRGLNLVPEPPQKSPFNISSLVDLLKRGEIVDVGEALHESWEKSKKLSQRDEVDEIYLDAREAGVLGGRILRDPEGGISLLLFVPFEKRAKVRSVLTPFQEIPFKRERDGSKVIFNVKR